MNECCAFCEEPAVEEAIPEEPLLVRRRPVRGGWVVQLVRLPLQPLCERHRATRARGAEPFGWCDEQGCRRWGPLGAVSPCGAPYLAVSSGSGPGSGPVVRRPLAKVPA